MNLNFVTRRRDSGLKAHAHWQGGGLGLQVTHDLKSPDDRIWKPIPVRIFYTFVIYQGYDMDILSGKSCDVIYQGYDMDIPNANNLERHILVIYVLTFGPIF